jgi:hypothetical protein
MPILVCPNCTHYALVPQKKKDLRIEPGKRSAPKTIPVPPFYTSYSGYLVVILQTQWLIFFL